jgi:membrane-bound ClpP family serine protease
MWVIAGILIGLVILSSLAGFHAGPHAHAVAAVAGVLAAAWFVVMLADGRSAPVVWALLGADLVVATGVGATAWKALTGRGTAGHWVGSLESSHGVAISDLAPHGVVRVGGEDWSASSVNGTVRTGEKVQIIRADGVRLEVWGEDAQEHPADVNFHIAAIEWEELGR